MVNKQEVGPGTVEIAEALKAGLEGDDAAEYPDGSPVVDADGDVLYPDGSVVVDPQPALLAVLERRQRADYITREVSIPDPAMSRNYPLVDLSA